MDIILVFPRTNVMENEKIGFVDIPFRWVLFCLDWKMLHLAGKQKNMAFLVLGPNDWTF